MKILKQNGQYSIISNFTIIDKLDNLYYELDWDTFGNVFLRETNKLVLPNKIYDFFKKNRGFILKSYHHSDKNLGVLLSGEKGTGKTIDAKLILQELDLPKILITKSIPKNVNFQSFLNTIEQNFILFVDEFEKLFLNYSGNDNQFHEQESMLQLLDGLNNEYKKLFIFIANTEVNTYLINRPSRIKYYIDYEGISEENAKIIINDLLLDKSFGENLLENLDLSSLTMDILISIIQEINIQNVPYTEFKDIFNYSMTPQEYLVFEKKENSTEFLLSDIEVTRHDVKSNYITTDETRFFKVHGTKEILFKSKLNSKHLLRIEPITKKINLTF